MSAAGFTHIFARLAAVALLLWACDAIAAATGRGAAQPDATVVAGDFPRPSLEVSTSTMPRLDGVDGAARSSRLDLSVMPQQHSGIGLSLGINTFSATLPSFGAPNSQSLDLGLRWRYMLDSHSRVDVTAYRRLPNNDAISLIESRDPSYGARVEMAFGSNRLRKGFVAEHGFVGLQLESGARLTVKRTGGVPMLYYRNTF